jgi:nitroreductase
MASVSPADVLHALHWRYATKKFDPAKKIPAETWAVLEEALVLTPSSMGMQPWKFIVVTDPAMQARLRPAAHDQAQTVDCSHFVVFAVRKNLDVAHIDRLFARISEVHGVPAEVFAAYRQSGTKLIDRARDEGRLDTWQTHQVYIALGNFLVSAALLAVDTCPMEGIEPPQFDEILGLAGTPYATVVACAAGYRLADDKSATRKKVRFKPEDVIERI